MPRPTKCRQIECLPKQTSFCSKQSSHSLKIDLTIDEYEAIKLIDYKGLTQDEAAFQMGVSRTTITSIYEIARRKIATFIVDGGRLDIIGGEYVISHGKENYPNFNLKEIEQMIVAVSFEEGEIFQHFGHTEFFKLFTIEKGIIKDSRIVSADGAGHSEIVDFLVKNKVDVLVCGGIGAKAVSFLSEAGIEVFAGNVGKVDDAITKFIKGELNKTDVSNCEEKAHGDSHCGDGDCHCK